MLAFENRCKLNRLNKTAFEKKGMLYRKSAEEKNQVFLIEIKTKWLIDLIMVLSIYHTQALANVDECTALPEDSRKECMTFVEKYPGHYTTHILYATGDIQIQDEHYVLYFLSAEDHSLKKPITIKNSNNIGIFGSRVASANTTLKLNYTSDENIHKLNMVEINSCTDCIISGFNVDPANTTHHSLDKLFKLEGYKTKIQLNDIQVDGSIASGFILVNSVDKIKISKFKIKGGYNNYTLNEAAIDIEGSREVTLSKTTLKELYPNTSKGIIRISNPFKLDINDVEISTSNNSESIATDVIGLNIIFNKFAKFKDKVVTGNLDNLRILHKGKSWPASWTGARLKAIPLFSDIAKNDKGSLVTGTVTVTKSSFPDNDGMLLKEGLPNINVIYDSSVSGTVSGYNTQISTPTLSPTTPAKLLVMSTTNIPTSPLKLITSTPVQTSTIIAVNSTSSQNRIKPTSVETPMTAAPSHRTISDGGTSAVNTSLPDGTEYRKSDNAKEGLSTGEKIGIAVGAVLGAAFVLTVSYCLRKPLKRAATGGFSGLLSLWNQYNSLSNNNDDNEHQVIYPSRTEDVWISGLPEEN